MIFFTIGVYNSSEIEFFRKLVENRIDLFCDIRRRRGVRGSKYPFVNSTKLQKKLSELGIKYLHALDLAPNQEMRGLQKRLDIAKGEKKTERGKLGAEFIIEYENKILDNFDFDVFLRELTHSKAERVVLFCVEEFSEACHRSITAKRLQSQYNCEIIDL